MPFQNVQAIVLGGGQGSRLYPLTKMRTKPAVPIGGQYRLIDISLSNCINSGITRAFILTQYLPASLHRHVHRTYQFDVFSRGSVEILPAEQTPDGEGWYKGTADAVRLDLGGTPGVPRHQRDPDLVDAQLHRSRDHELPHLRQFQPLA